jgi:sugar (pentulose or hexulose) kinase
VDVLIGIDIGTTNSKVGVFTAEGQSIKTVNRPTETLQSVSLGYSYYDPQRMWEGVRSAIVEALAGVEQAKVAAIGITSMAESGLLVDRSSGKPRSPFLPWFDTCSEPQAARMKKESDAFERFLRSGLHGSFKLGLPKLMWLRDHFPEAFDGEEPVWLSASGWIAYCLTGAFAFDYTLAARTYAFRIDRKEWDADWLKQFGFSASLFPDAAPSGAVIGRVRENAEIAGLAAGTPVGIAGHDHVASALAVGAIRPGVVYDSMGTAETLVGTMDARPLTKEDFEAGLSFGIHAAEGRYFWMGGQASSGGSVEWLRSILGERELTYGEVLALLDELGPESGPTGVLYFPYLTGSSAPRPDSRLRAAFIGLSKEHGRAHLLKAALEGTAYQLEFIKRSAERLAGGRIERLLVVGGGTRNPHWLSVKADITGCTLELPGIPEASLLGAALAAAIGAGVYASAEEAYAAAADAGRRSGGAADGGAVGVVAPDAGRHELYRALYERGFEPLQGPLRHWNA